MSDDPNILFQQDFDTILTAQTITISAENGQEITAVSAAGSYGDKAAINGSVSQNIISGSTRATVADQPKLAGSTAVNVLATDSSSIAIAGAAAISDGKPLPQVRSRRMTSAVQQKCWSPRARSVRAIFRSRL